MVENVWGLVAVLVFYVVILVIGIVAGRKELSRKSKSSTTETMLAGRGIGMFVGVFTMTATWVGGGYINGTAEAVYKAVEGNGQGLVWAQAPVGFSISLFIAGVFFAKPMREAGYMTMIDPFQKKLGDWMGAVLVLPAVSGEIFWSASILSALGSTLSVIIGLELWISVIVSACVALLYVVIGGLASVVFTDVIQLFCIAVGLVTAIPFAMQHHAVGDVFASAPNSTVPGWLGHIEGRDWGLFVDDYLLLMFGGIPWQVYFQRVLASRSPQVARSLSFLGSFGCLIMAVPPALIGAIGYSTDWNQTSYSGAGEDGTVSSSLVVPLVLQYLTPPVVAVIGLGAVSAAVMSSADSSMLSSSTMFAQNVYKPVFRPQASAREVIWVMRLAAVAFCAIATVLAITIKTIYGLFVMVCYVSDYTCTGRRSSA
ncbi:high-affinity choline transporter 1-like isoform X2 [Watersipora subatra]|uniref:high-affinity choline transporter 1-like isoform X2 n=1 Tax=Watersipora subatra TaxID=2589382 RepID=UPI00355BB78E